MWEINHGSGTIGLHKLRETSHFKSLRDLSNMLAHLWHHISIINQQKQRGCSQLNLTGGNVHSVCNRPNQLSLPLPVFRWFWMWVVVLVFCLSLQSRREPPECTLLSPTPWPSIQRLSPLSPFVFLMSAYWWCTLTPTFETGPFLYRKYTLTPTQILESNVMCVLA